MCLGQGSKVKITRLALLNLVNKINPFYIAKYKVNSVLNSAVGHIFQCWHCSCYTMNPLPGYSMILFRNFYIFSVCKCIFLVKVTYNLWAADRVKNTVWQNKQYIHRTY